MIHGLITELSLPVELYDAVGIKISRGGKNGSSPTSKRFFGSLGELFLAGASVEPYCVPVSGGEELE